MNLTNSDIIDTNPGASSRGTGPKWTPGQYDDLMLPNGSTVGQTDNERLRKELMRLGIQGAATEGRNIIVARYAVMMRAIHDDAGSKAVSKWLEDNRS